ncbi:hypothetical protein QYM36_012989 [Artemia franciscana]|uniref:PIF1/LRR1 pleckstrin homology domain-containing protein n=2 Tax=Artemia franciscana TaxID=6661 RepID=A0AA88HHM8_ARTSF|nr:hypothetical protein QYM36_012989 [Artemia franciscana]
MIVLQIHFEKFNKNFIGHSATKKCRVSFEKQDGAMYFIAEIVKPDGTFGCKHEFKINGNVSQMFYTFINDGKTTIRFKIPDICLSLRGKPEQVAKITVAIAKLSGLKDDAKKIMEETKLVLPSPDAQKDAQKSTKTKSSLTDLPPSKKPKVELEKLKLEIRSHKEFIQVSHLPLTLTTLKIGNVQFSRLDQRCLRLVNLQWLTVNNTQLETLPESMDIFPNLCVLDLGNNYISDLPRMFFRTLSPNLTVLNLSKNKLTYLSEDISKLKNLKALYVRHNQLTRIPWKIGLLPNLSRFLIYVDLFSSQLSELGINIEKRICTKPDHLVASLHKAVLPKFKVVVLLGSDSVEANRIKIYLLQGPAPEPLLMEKEEGIRLIVKTCGKLDFNKNSTPGRMNESFKTSNNVADSHHHPFEDSTDNDDAFETQKEIEKNVEKIGADHPPEMAMLLSFLVEDSPLTISEYEKIILYTLEQRGSLIKKEYVDNPDKIREVLELPLPASLIPGAALLSPAVADLKNEVLRILNTNTPLQ